MYSWQEIVVRHSIRREMLEQVDFSALSDDEKTVFEEELNRRCDEMKEFVEVSERDRHTYEKSKAILQDSFPHVPVAPMIPNSLSVENLIVDLIRQKLIKVYGRTNVDITNLITTICEVYDFSLSEAEVKLFDSRYTPPTEQKILQEFTASTIMRELERRGLITLVNEGDTTDSYDMSDLLRAFMDMKNEK